MAINVNWIIEWVEIKLSETDNTIVVVNGAWRCLATNGVKNNSKGSSFVFDAPIDTFSPYAKWDKQQVLEWIWKTVDQAEIESIVCQKINDQVNLPSIKCAPPLIDAKKEVK